MIRIFKHVVYQSGSPEEFYDDPVEIAAAEDTYIEFESLNVHENKIWAFVRTNTSKGWAVIHSQPRLLQTQQDSDKKQISQM